MKVAELIELLQQHPRDMLVAYRCCSESVLLQESDISVLDACAPRADGWIQNSRRDMPNQSYLLFPGN